MQIKDKRITTIWRLSKDAYGPYKRQIFLLTILGFFSGILEGIGVNALIPMLSFVVADKSTPSDFISQALEKLFGFFHVTFNLKYLLIFICSLFVFKAVVLVFSNYIKVKITADYEKQTREVLFGQTLRTKWRRLLKQRLGFLSDLLITDVSCSAALLNEISVSIIAMTSLLVYILIAFNISPRITLIALGLGCAMFLVFKPLIYRTREFSKKRVEVNKQISHYVNENVLGMKTVKAMAVEGPVQRLSEQFFENLKRIRIKLKLMRNITATSVQPISLIFICVVFGLSYLTESFSLAAFLAIVYLVQRIFSYFQSLQKSLHQFNTFIPHLKKVLDYQKAARKEQEEDNGREAFVFQDKLAFNNVSFSYEKGYSVVDKVSFDLRKGEMVGLIGPSGAGKTTIVDLITRLFQPTSGQVMLDDKDISQISLKEFRGKIGYVSQDIFLINDTVENNIKFYNSEISEQDVIEASKIANAFQFIEDLPDKFQTKVGERGLRLSGGQRQRIILARALARKPQFLILDEATNALDNESEVLIQKAIEQLKGKTTILVIAHRLSTVVNADRLFVLEKGRIVEQGSPQELLEDKGSYFYKVYNIRD